MLAVILKLLAPIVAIYLGVRAISNILKKTKDVRNLTKNPPDEVIEICPECGTVKGRRHHCG